MCISKKDLERKVQEIRSLKALKEELEGNINSLENEVISYMNENHITEEFTETSKITYLPQERKTLDKAKVREVLGDLTKYEKVTSYNVLRIK